MPAERIGGSHHGRHERVSQQLRALGSHHGHHGRANAEGEPRRGRENSFDRSPISAPGAEKPRSSAFNPRVDALLSKYGIRHDKYNRGQERLLLAVATVDDLIANAPAEEPLATTLVGHDARRVVFLLEGLFRMYDGKQSESFAALTDRIKALEDNLGDSVLYPGLIKIAEESKLPDEVLGALKEKKAAQDASTEAVVAKDWSCDAKGRVPAIADIVREVVNADIGNYEHDRRFFLKKIAKELRDIDLSSYDLTQPETGIHELRRDLRWIPVYVEAGAGLIQLDEKRNPVPELESILSTPLANDKYVQLPPPGDERQPVAVSKSLYTALMKTILDLGETKGRYEPLALIADLYVELGLAKSVPEARAKVDALVAPQEPESLYRKEAADAVGELKRHNLLENLAQELERAVDSKPAVP